MILSKCVAIVQNYYKLYFKGNKIDLKVYNTNSSGHYLQQKSKLWISLKPIFLYIYKIIWGSSGLINQPIYDPIISLKENQLFIEVIHFNCKLKTALVVNQMLFW